MPTISRRNLVLLMLGIDPDGEIAKGIGGITRLQKLLYLLEREENLTPTENGFDFSAYKAGPYSSKLYDDLEFLENLGFVESEVTADATLGEAAEVELLDFEELLGDGAENSNDEAVDGIAAADAFEERRFKITDEGTQRIQSLLESEEYKPLSEGIRRVKRKYGTYSLSDLLYYVYEKYPDMTVESEIKDQVFRGRNK
ncbi:MULTISPECIES: Panacea domain-containing protein [Gimesia]|uniref:Antitoxin SocA-like Panacea domain-containing protein n=1 Tax=Gimesia maris TaxID=122 RepID=A0ABX5YQE6_9PLAN|nr:hypothetical protein [Gimesia maris]QEG17852.1 hypothetical protein GmarT_37360 [Gimesia maris]QGQ29114.1 hypothetical protein F1729_10880 [Gimesia maris]